MNWIAAIFNGLLTGVLGFFAAMCVGAACVKWYHISGFEGGSGYFVAMLSILGAVIGFLVGLVIGHWFGAASALAFFKGLGMSLGTVLAIAGISAGICWELADIPPKIDGKYLDLEVEFKLPISVTNRPVNAAPDWDLMLGSVVNHVQRKSCKGKLKLSEARFENGRWIVPGSVDVFTMRGLRSISTQIEGESFGFIVPLPARPGKRFEQWSDWEPRPRRGAAPWPDTNPAYRFRVQPIEPPPPPPDPAVLVAQAFAALKPDAPLEDWLSFLRSSAPPERTQAILEVAENRQQELASLIGSTNSTTRETALSIVPQLKNIAPEVRDAVLAEGKKVAEGVRRFNEMKSDAPDFLDVQVELRTRFSYWKQAWWTVQQRLDLDGRSPIKEIYDLALIRSRETTIDEIVINAKVILDALPTLAEKPL